MERELSKPEKEIYITIGKKISDKRKSSRKKIQGISKKLNINVEYIDCIEKGELEKIPTNLPIRGFIRSYAKLIGTDILPELSQLEEIMLTDKNKLIKKMTKRKNENLLFWYFLIFLIIVFLSINVIIPTNNQKKLHEKITPYGINYNIIKKET